MSLFLTLADLFFIGSVFGWVLELFFRHWFSSSNPEHRWINPGFCVGPYVPLYGFGLCILYLLAVIGKRCGLEGSLSGRLILFACMAASMTLIEYIAGIYLLKVMKLRLWDYSELRGNIQGLVCPLFSFFWALLGALYYFLIHPYVLGALDWLARNLAFSFVIGFFFGVFTIDVAYSGHMVSRLKKFAEENEVVVRYEHLKAHIRRVQERIHVKPRFFFPLHTEAHPLERYLRDAEDVLERRRMEAEEELRGRS
ncbi:MAG: putative ABC transporter permease [Oscillospiraceae bacterium]|nr:putative ABC transporter permease [Oscillospiraceae bacterium]